MVDKSCHYLEKIELQCPFSLALFPGFYQYNVLDENEYIEPEPEPYLETTEDVKTSITVMNTLENIITETDYILDPDEDGLMLRMTEDLGSGGGSGAPLPPLPPLPVEETDTEITQDPTDEMMTGIDPRLLESTNDAIIVNNDVEIFRFLLSYS